MGGGRETAHVDADLRDDGLSGEVADAGDGPQQADRVTERVEATLHFRVDLFQRLRQRVVLAQVQAEQEAAAGADAPGVCREFRVWAAMMGRKELPHGATQRASDP